MKTTLFLKKKNYLLFSLLLLTGIGYSQTTLTYTSGEILYSRWRRVSGGKPKIASESPIRKWKRPWSTMYVVSLTGFISLPFHHKQFPTFNPASHARSTRTGKF